MRERMEVELKKAKGHIDEIRTKLEKQCDDAHKRYMLTVQQLQDNLDSSEQCQNALEEYK